MTSQFSNNTTKNRYEYNVDGAIVFANYHQKDGMLYIDYVEAPPQLRGSGAAGKLMEKIVETARAESLKIVPICGYASSWLTRHPEHKDLKAQHSGADIQGGNVCVLRDRAE